MYEIILLVDNLPEQGQDQALGHPSGLCAVLLRHGAAVSETSSESHQKVNMFARGSWWLLLCSSKPCRGWGPNASCGDDLSWLGDSADVVPPGRPSREAGSRTLWFPPLLLSEVDRRFPSSSCSVVWGSSRTEVGSVLCPAASEARVRRVDPRAGQVSSWRARAAAQASLP